MDDEYVKKLTVIRDIHIRVRRYRNINNWMLYPSFGLLSLIWLAGDKPI